MKYNNKYAPSDNKRRTVNLFIFVNLAIAVLFFSNLNAQRQLKTSFTLDTTRAQIFPSDLDFSLNIIDSEENRIKYVYLLRLNAKGEKVVFDRHTKFKRARQSTESRQRALAFFNKRLDSIYRRLKVPENKCTGDSLHSVLGRISDLKLRNDIEKYLEKNKEFEKQWNSCKFLKPIDKHKFEITFIKIKGELIEEVFHSTYKEEYEKNKRNLNNERENLVEIKRLLDKLKEQAKEKVMKKSGEEASKEKESLTQIKEQIDKLKEELLKLDCKIDFLKLEKSKHERDSALFANLKQIQKSIDSFRKQMRLGPLPIKDRNGDTLTVEVHPLRPNKNYLILAMESGRQIATFKNLVKNYLECSSSLKREEITLIPKKYIRSQDKSIVKFVHFPDEFEKQLNSILKTEKQKNKVDSLLKKEESKLHYAKLNVDIEFPGPYKFPFCDSCSINKDSTFSGLDVPKEFYADFRLLNSFLTSFNKYGDDLINGKYRLIADKTDLPEIDFNPKVDFKSRLDNVINHIKLATDTQRSLYLLGDIEKNEYSIFNEYFKEIITKLDANRIILEDRIKGSKELNDIVGKIKLRAYGLDANVLKKETHSYQFLTRNKGYIKPSFGFIGYSSGRNGFSGIAPYSGVDILIRSVNEDVNFWRINGWQKFITFQLSIPLFAEELTAGGQRKHLVGDAFSLYTGFGVNLGHSFKISYGPIWFRSVDGNLLGERNYKINAVHAISLGINFKLNSLFKTIFGSDNGVNLVK